MEDLIRALGHINFYLADADEIFSGRKIKTFDRERIRIFLEVEMLKDIRTYTEAQSVEHSAVNRVVVGSSPTGGAKNPRS